MEQTVRPAIFAGSSSEDLYDIGLHPIQWPGLSLGPKSVWCYVQSMELHTSTHDDSLD